MNASHLIAAALRLASIALVFGVLSACDPAGPGIVVDLRTDLSPGRDFVGVRTEYAPSALAPGEAAESSVERLLPSGTDTLSGVRVAEIGVVVGPAFVRVTLVGADGGAVAGRDYVLDVISHTSLTAIVTASCGGVVCPDASDAPGLTACQGGRCVDPRCSPEFPEFCPAAACADDADCSTALECGAGVCLAGDCFVDVDDARCPVGDVCDVRAGCVEMAAPDDAGAPPTDAGPGCPPRELACADGVDEDCDGMMDCADPDCAGDACDDGVFCNGADTCAEGACSAHSGNPCPVSCNEGAMACDACAVDADCGAVTYGGWSACGGYSDTCDATGTRDRSVSTPRCVSGSCTVVPSTETGGCSRASRDGRSCRSTSYGGWGSCGYSSTCDESATQSRSVTTYTCGGGSCSGSTGSESRGCSRSTTGNSCVLIPGCPASCLGGACDPICAAMCPC